MTKANIYKMRGMTLMSLSGHKKGHIYSLEFLEGLTGFKLRPNTPEVLAQWGYVRVCDNDENSYRLPY